MEKGSKFHAMAYPVSAEAEVQQKLAILRKTHPKARHFCTAMRIGIDVILERSSDDGEPSGSAGKPILGQLIKHQLTEIFVVVIRYFGGTKLGIPGLIEAYRDSTADALSKATFLQKVVYSSFQVSMPYVRFSSFKNMIMDKDLPVFHESFDENAKLTFGLRSSTAEPTLMSLLREYSQRDYTLLADYEAYLDLRIEKSDTLVIV